MARNGPTGVVVDKCHNKRRYSTKSKAKTVASNMRREGKRGVHAYKCPVCLKWHVGNAGGAR